MGFIYKITNTISGKCYIGETKRENPELRWKQHIQKINNGEGCPALRDAIKKYGLDKFKFEVLIICFDEDRYKYEVEYIKKYNSQVPNGYNILQGGIGGAGFQGKKHTKESIQKIVEGGQKFRKENPNHYETYREKHQKSMKNVDISSAIKNSEKWKKAVQEGRIGGKNNNIDISSAVKNSEKFKKAVEEGRVGKANINKNISDTIKQKIKESVIKYCNEKKDIMPIRSNSRKINQYTKNNEFINEYISIASAGRLSGINKSSIRSVLIGRNQTAGGYIWKYAD